MGTDQGKNRTYICRFWVETSGSMLRALGVKGGHYTPGTLPPRLSRDIIVQAKPPG